MPIAGAVDMLSIGSGRVAGRELMESRRARRMIISGPFAPNAAKRCGINRIIASRRISLFAGRALMEFAHDR